MASPSKEDRVLKLILEQSPLKEWHFEELVREAKVTRAIANKWLKRYLSEKLVQRVKKPGRFPHFTAGKNNAIYEAKKRLYALEQLYQSGLIAHLTSLPNIKTAIIFGSIARGDWYKDSDIDLFIFGDATGFEKAPYERQLKRTIEIHLFENKQQINAIKSGLLKNVINGYLVKGQIQDIAEVV